MEIKIKLFGKWNKEKKTLELTEWSGNYYKFGEIEVLDKTYVLHAEKDSGKIVLVRKFV